MTTIHTFLVDPADEAREAMAGALDEGEPWVALDSLPRVAQSIDRGSVPAVVLVGPGIVHDDTMMLAESIQDERLAVRLIQFAKALDPDHLRDALRAGVADVVEVGAHPHEIVQAVTRARREVLAQVRAMQSAAPPDLRDPTPVVAVTAGKGGVGTSLVTVNLAVGLARQGIRVGLVDLDVASGDLAIMLQSRPSLTVLDAIDRIDHLDEDAMDGYVTRVSDRVELLAAPLDGGDVLLPTGPFMKVLSMVSERVDLVLVDVGQPNSSTARAVLSGAQEVILVTTLEVTSVRGARRVLGELDAMGVGRGGVRLVANQSDAATGLSAGDAQKALGHEFDAYVPSDKSAMKSVNQGDPLVNRRRSKAGQALAGIASAAAEAVGVSGDE